MTKRPTADGWTPLPFRDALVGHFLVGMIGGVVSFVLLLVAPWVHLAPTTSGATIFRGALIAWLIVSAGGAVIDRRFVLAARHDDPGSGSKTACLVAWNALAGVASGLFIGMGDPGWVLAGLLAVSLGFGIDIALLTEPWKDGSTREDARRRRQELDAETGREQADDGRGPRSS